MTMAEWFCEYRYNVGEPTVGGSGITETRLSELETWAEEVKAKRNGSTKN